MGTNIIIGFAAVTLIGGILAFVASKTWKIVDVIFLFLVFWAAFFYLVLAVRVSNMRGEYQAQAEKIRPQLENVLIENRALEQGVNQEIGEQVPVIEGLDEAVIELGLVKLGPQVNRLTQDRGRVWKDCEKLGLANNRMDVSVPSPDPHNIPVGKVLFIFEQGPFQDGARYLGEFRVTSSEPKKISIEPVKLLSPQEIQRVVQSNKKWRLYESVPVDQHELLTSLTPEEIQVVFPPETVQEYLKDGKPAAADDPDDRKMWFNPDGTLAPEDDRKEGAVLMYVRALRDYHMSFETFFNSRSENAVLKKQADTDIDLLKTSLASAEADLKTRQTEQASLNQDVTKFETELTFVEKFLADLTSQKEKLDARLAELSLENARLAQEYSRQQLEAVRRIDEATGGPLGAEPGN